MRGWSEFWQMGGYARYVWSAYGVTAVLLAAELVQLVLRRRAVSRRLKQMRDLRQEIRTDVS
jgi:heme exporter protein D